LRGATLKEDFAPAGMYCYLGAHIGVVRCPLDQPIQPVRVSTELPVWSGNNHRFIQKLCILAGSWVVNSLIFRGFGLSIGQCEFGGEGLAEGILLILVSLKRTNLRLFGNITTLFQTYTLSSVE
jgi:hypothetical protein